ncbi:MAG: hypothetical protein EOO60_07880 [Hymenobacter sp.]|nr:MAG: hypothetical protein EOO60_07880 [Hymenobacter sp.]
MFIEKRGPFINRFYFSPHVYFLLDLLVFLEERELLGFFESEPELLDPQAPWHYNGLTCRRTQADKTLTGTFSSLTGT